MVNSTKLSNLLLRGWFKTKGRSSRQEYISRFLMMWFFLIIGISIRTPYQTTENIILAIFFVLLSFLTLLLMMISLIQMLFVTHRRLHDLNASGWWQIITFIPLGQLLMICFIFFKGTKGSNKYGPPPEY